MQASANSVMNRCSASVWSVSASSSAKSISLIRTLLLPSGVERSRSQTALEQAPLLMGKGSEDDLSDRPFV